MSGREKHAPADPAEERAQLRQLTRELHEAAQDARDAARELRKARQEIWGAAEAAIEDIVNRHQEEINQVIEQNYESVQRAVCTQEQQTRDHYTGLLSTDVKELILRTCGSVLHLSMDNMSIEDWMQVLQAAAAEHEAVKCGCAGCLTLRGVKPPTVIQVGTRAEVNRLQAAGVDVGTVIDLTRL